MHHHSSITGLVLSFVLVFSFAIVAAVPPANAASVISGRATRSGGGARKNGRIVPKPTKNKNTPSAASSAPAVQGSFPYALSVNADWKTRWNIIEMQGTAEALSNVDVQHEEGSFPNFLRVRFPKGSGNTSLWQNYEKPLGGILAWIRPDIKPVQDMYFSYYVRFPKDFDFSLQGTLPGIVAGSKGGISEGTFATVYLTWEKDGKVTLAGNFDRKAVRPSNVVETDARFGSDGEWHRIDLHAVLSTGPGKSNGMIEFFFDGKKIAMQKTVMFVHKASDEWDGMTFYVDVGRLDVMSVSPKDMHVDLAGFTFSDKPLLK